MTSKKNKKFSKSKNKYTKKINLYGGVTPSSSSSTPSSLSSLQLSDLSEPIVKSSEQSPTIAESIVSDVANLGDSIKKFLTPKDTPEKSPIPPQIVESKAKTKSLEKEKLLSSQEALPSSGKLKLTISKSKKSLSSSINKEKQELVNRELSDFYKKLETQDDKKKLFNEFLDKKENLNRIDILQNRDYNFLYPSLDDPNFNIKIAEKKEFYDTANDIKIKNVKEEADVICNIKPELAPHQQFVRNFLSFQDRKSVV